MPRQAPEFSAGIARLGVRQGRRTLPEGQEPLLAPPVENEERRKQAASGSPFLWVLSFGEAKESTSPSGARPRLK